MKTIKIGTRSSQLALWQANTVAKQLEHLGHTTEIIKIESFGDIVLDKPLYELGITGVFTKNLDIALLNKKIDIAVHSCKDVPTKLPKGITEAAFLKRGRVSDVLVLKNNESFFENPTATIATGSLRRKAQWLHRYPNHNIVGLRGNVNTRLQKLQDNNWNGAIFAAAGLKRLGLLPKNIINLDWMIPAPAQGTVMVVALEENQELLEICKEINDADTEKCVTIEREFLRTLEGGCAAPIGALAKIKDNIVDFKGVLFSYDGSQKIEYTKTLPINKTKDLGKIAANYILERGGKKLMRERIQIEKETVIYSTRTISKAQKDSFPLSIGIEMADFITTRSNRLKPTVIKHPIKNVIFTSKNAVKAILDNFSPAEVRFENIYCVGRRTKRLIEKNFGKVIHVENYGKKLGEHLVQNLKEKEVTFFCGNKRRDELINILKNNSVTVNEIEAYQTQLTPKKMPKNKNIKAILFYSPSAVQSFMQQNKTTNKIAFCIGTTTAKEAEKHFNQVIISKTPLVESVLQAAKDYFKPQKAQPNV